VNSLAPIKDKSSARNGEIAKGESSGEYLTARNSK